MKTIIRTFVLVFAVMAFASAANAQKFAHVNTDSLVMEISLRDSIDQRVQTKQGEYGTHYQMLLDEYTRADADYKKKAADKTMPPSIVAYAKKSVEDVAARMQKFENDAQTELQDYEMSLMQPLIAEIKAAINEVAKEKGYTYVINEQVLLVSPPADDITNLVRKKLGL